MGNVILVVSGKREIGKTVIGIKTGIELSKRGKNVVLVDLSSGKIKISDYFNESENIIYDVKDVLDNTCSAEQATITIRDNLNIIPYPRITDKLGNIKREGLINLIKEIKDNYDVIIIDIDSLVSAHYVNFEDISGVIIIDNNDFSSTADINSEYGIANTFGIEKIIVIINKYNKKGASKGMMLDLKEIEKILSTQIISTIEENNKYMNIDFEFINSDERNSLNYAVDNIIKAMQL
jgi:septum formation inhibitor-activating ATPase MinD